MKNYFNEHCGLKCPERSNPADFALQIVTSDFTNDSTVEKILHKWATTGQALSDADADQANQLAPSGLPVELEQASIPSPPGFHSQCAAVLRRDIRVMITDPMLYLARIVSFWFMSAFMGLLWIEGRGYDNTYVMSKTWPVVMIQSSSTICALVAVYFHHRAAVIYSGEIRNGFYPPFVSLVSSTIISIPCIFLMSVSSIFGNLYGISG
jgi:hypothetical protein